MSRIRLALGSLLLASTLAGCAAHSATSTLPLQPARQEVAIDRAQVRAKLAARRTAVIERFLAYREGRVYPVNNLGGGKRHLWVDDFGNLCAAATLISGDWGRDATLRAGAANREMELAAIKDGPLLGWILTSGLTHHEIVAIQVPGDDLTMPELAPDEGERLYQIYVDVERQLRTLGEHNLELAVDALMQRPALARALLRDQIAGPDQPVPAEGVVAVRGARPRS